MDRTFRLIGQAHTVKFCDCRKRLAQTIYAFCLLEPKMTSYESFECVNRTIEYDSRMDGWYTLEATSPYHVNNQGVHFIPE